MLKRCAARSAFSIIKWALTLENPKTHGCNEIVSSLSVLCI